MRGCFAVDFRVARHSWLKAARVRHHAESDMTKNAKDELERQKLDLELDRELEERRSLGFQPRQTN